MRTRPPKNCTGADLIIGTLGAFFALLVGSVIVMLLVDSLAPSALKAKGYCLTASGLVFVVVFWPALVGIARGRVKRRWRRYTDERNRALSARRCPHCEYDLRGTVEPRCPECGEQFTAQEWALTSAEHRV